jgi:hypothetical protein
VKEGGEKRKKERDSRVRCEKAKKILEKLGIEPRTFSILESMLRKRHTTRPHPLVGPEEDKLKASSPDWMKERKAI